MANKAVAEIFDWWASEAGYSDYMSVSDGVAIDTQALWNSSLSYSYGLGDDSNLPRYKKKSKSFLGYNDSSPSLFEEQREQEKTEQMARGEYHTSDFVFDMLLDFVNIFLVKKKIKQR